MAEPDHQFDFHLEEYKSLRAEMMSLQGERRLTDRLGASAMIAIYAWLLSKGDNVPSGLSNLAFFLPTLIAYLCYLQSTRISKGIRSAGTDLAHLESNYAHPEVGGWEHMLSHLREEGELPQPASKTRNWLDKRVRLDRLSSLSADFWLWSIAGTFGFGAVINALLLSATAPESAP
ncbi:MAG: hypothetical protein AAGE80_07610 [Pseudomonadota bacterium]